jgi:hypothetical protein
MLHKSKHFAKVDMSQNKTKYTSAQQNLSSPTVASPLRTSPNDKFQSITKCGKSDGKSSDWLGLVSVSIPKPDAKVHNQHWSDLTHINQRHYF